ncbi:MAG: DNA-processing protein DprA [Deltaproteobacteria bacterium]|nr:DNA-processing protein DprA [Deltaproteobacteria bacterium]
MDKHCLARGGDLYPDILCTRLGEDAPATLTAIGSLAHLAQRKTALFCSARTPGHIILAAYDQAARWRDAGRCVISGFHSPVEKECLRILLRGRQPVIICLARGVEGMRLPAEWKAAMADNRLLVLSPFPASERRVTKSLATDRNRLVAALADEVVFGHITPGGHLDELRWLIVSWRVPQRVLSDGAELPS